MPKWTDYTTKTTVADNDEIMALDTAEKVNKRLLLSVLSDWVLGKIADKVFGKLQTNDKTILGAINELNSKIQGGSTENIYYFSAADFETGGYDAAGKKIDATKTLRTITTYPVSAGDSVRIKKVSKNQYAAVSVFYDGSFHDLNYWTNAESVVNIDHAGELIVLIANNQRPYEGVDMVPGDYVEQVLLVRA